MCDTCLLSFLQQLSRQTQELRNLPLFTRRSCFTRSGHRRARVCPNVTDRVTARVPRLSPAGIRRVFHGQKQIKKSKDSGHAPDTSGGLEVDSRSTCSALLCSAVRPMPAWLFTATPERRRSHMNNILSHAGGVWICSFALPCSGAGGHRTLMEVIAEG